MKIATVFSGIGAPEYALRKICPTNMEIVFACDCGETLPLDEKTIKKISSVKNPRKRQELVKKEYGKIRNHHFIKQVYFSNYEKNGMSEEKWHDDIRFIDGKIYKGSVDLFVGGSPCQSFSNMGKRRGLEDARGTLFYDFARLIKEIEPKAFIYENVTGMLSHDGGRTWEVIKNIFKSLGYNIVLQDVLNSKDFGIPQNRKRIFVVGVKDKKVAEHFKKPKTVQLTLKAKDFLENDVPSRYYLSEKGFRFVTQNKSRARINMDVIRTQKRNQQFNWNGDFIFENVLVGKEYGNAYVGRYNDKIGVVRKMTPRECHRLMGFGDDFILCNNDTQAYKQAGNSIVVDVIEAIIKSLVEAGLND